MKYLNKTLITAFLLCCASGCFEGPEEVITDPGEPLRLLWETEHIMRGFGDGPPPTAVGDSLVLVTGDKSLTCLRIEDGAIKWINQVSDVTALGGNMFLIDEANIYAQHIEDFRAWDIQTGTELWRIEMPDDRGYIGPYHSQNDDTLFITGNHRLLAASKTGQVLYSIPIPGITSAVYANGNVYCGHLGEIVDTTYGGIKCLVANSADSLWDYFEGDGTLFYHIPIIRDGVIYYGTTGMKGAVIALDQSTGEQLWIYEGIWVYDLILEGDVLFGVHGNGVFAIDATNGSLLWYNDLEVGAGDSNVVYHDGYLYHAHTGALWVFDAVTGEDVHMQLAPDKSYIRKVGKSSNRIFVQSYSHWSCYMPYDSSAVMEGG